MTAYRRLIKIYFGKKPFGRPRSKGKDDFNRDKITGIGWRDDRWKELTPYYVNFEFGVRGFESELCIV
jgi:hypothetical protein